MQIKQTIGLFTAARSATSIKLFVTVFFVLLANYLFFQSPIGSTIGLFCILLLAAIWYFQPLKHRVSPRRLAAIAALLAAASMTEAAHWLQFAVFTVLTTILALLPKLPTTIEAPKLLMAVLGYFLKFWLRIGIDFSRISKIKAHAPTKFSGARVLGTIFLPIITCAIFAYLFYLANPIISDFLNKLDLTRVFEFFSIQSLLFSAFVMLGTWALIRPHIKNKIPIVKASVISSDKPFYDFLFNQNAVLLSLALLNCIFAFQNTLDVYFLWSGAELPKGVTHAQYAHRGAYPLILTALLAAAFVLFALKNKENNTRNAQIHILIYIWICQNIFLVASSILRTIEYIKVYSLTEMRIAAIIWMGLVALGLGLIIVKIFLRKSNAWLVNANSFSLAAVILVSCFVNFGSIISWANVQNCRQLGGNGNELDITYLASLGPSSLPALIWAKAHAHDNEVFANALGQSITILDAELRLNVGDWRSITFRQYRLSNEVGQLSQ